MTDHDPASRAELEALGKRIDQNRRAAGLVRKEKPDVSASKAAGDGLRVAIEFVVSVCVGAGLGFAIGHWAGNRAIGMIIGLLVGFAAGMRGIYRQLMANAAELDAASEGKNDADDPDDAQRG